MRREPPTTSRRWSAIGRLRELPQIFSGAELTARFGLDSNTASVLLSRWGAAGLVEPLGAKSDLYANTVRGASLESHLQELLARAIPSAIVIGWRALLDGNWTTQVPGKLALAVRRRSRGSMGRYPGTVLRARPAAWYDVIAQGLITEPGMLPRLRPAWALADMLAHEPARPAPDDLYLPDDVASLRDFARATRVLLPGRDGPGAKSLEEAYETLFHEIGTPIRGRAGRALRLPPAARVG